MGGKVLELEAERLKAEGQATGQIAHFFSQSLPLCAESTTFCYRKHYYFF